jgi:ADP-ribose pyrophosphatase
MDNFPDEALCWTVHGDRVVYDNPWARVLLRDVTAPNGQRFESHVIRLGRVAMALLVDEEDRMLTLWRYRFTTDQWGYEIIGGIVEDDETPVEAAAREAVEESGWEPVGEPEHLINFQPFPGMVDAPVDVFLWRRARQVGQPTDTEEAARIEWTPIREIVDLARQGKLLGSGTLVAVLLYIAMSGTNNA